MSSNIPPLNTLRRRSGVSLKITAAVCAAVVGTAAAIVPAQASVATKSAPAIVLTSASAVDAKAAAPLPSSIKKAGVLNDGVNLPNPPLEYQVNGKGPFTGFDIALAKALAAKLGLKIHYENVAFTALLTSIDSGRVDMVLSALFDTAAREQKYNVLDYLNTGSQIITTTANKSKAPTLVSLCGQTVETAVGTAFTQQLATLSTTLCAGKSPLKVLNEGGSFADEVLQIKTGRAVAAICTTDNLAYEDVTDPGAYVPVGKPFDSQPYGIDIPKSDPGLEKALQAALTDLIADGTYAKIAAEFHEQSGKVTKAVLNSAA